MLPKLAMLFAIFWAMATVTLAMPFNLTEAPDSIMVGNKQLFRKGTPAPDYMIKRVFGTSNFSDFLASERIKHANASDLVSRATYRVCQTDCHIRMVLKQDARKGIDHLFSLADYWSCGNDRPGACTCMYGDSPGEDGVCLGVCGDPGNPAWHMQCNKMAWYWNTILGDCWQTCRRCTESCSRPGEPCTCYNEDCIKGYQGLNERIQEYAFIDFYDN